MKINKLKVTENLKRIICVPFVGLIMATSFSGCSEKQQIVTIEDGEYDDKIFDEGEHIISIEINDPTKENIQYEYHEGYRPIGISTEAYGHYGYDFGKAHILYVNEYPVKCKATYQKDSELFYTDFGEPLQYEREKTETGSKWEEFNAGEHIISIPLNKQELENYQIDYYDGYEPIGIASSSYGHYEYSYGGGCILYTNTEKVKCIKDENGNYTSFGIPKEDAKSLKK